MKKIFTLCISLLMGCAALNAQTFAFVDGKGNTIENGSTLTLTDIELTTIYAPDTQIPITEGFSVKNISGATANFDIKFTVISKPGGTFQVCPKDEFCVADDKSPIISFTNRPSLAAGATDDFSATEWKPGAMGTVIGQEDFGGGFFMDIYGEPFTGGAVGTCSVEIEVGPRGYTTPDSKITANFVYSTGAGISGVETEKDNAVVGYYTIDGVKLNAPQKGLNIVKRADGTTTKVLVK